jgi:hypothetical protein
MRPMLDPRTLTLMQTAQSPRTRRKRSKQAMS